MAHMTESEAQTFLAEPRVCILSIAQRDRAPLTVPIWFHYAAGGNVGFWMDGASYKVKLLRATPRLSLCVQDERRPYRYVSVEGEVTSIAPIDFERDLKPLVARYLDAAGAAAYLAELGGADGIAGDVWVTVTPRRWRAEDLGR